MQVELLLTPNEYFIADIPKADRMALARELESGEYYQGEKDLMYNGAEDSWSALGVWEWLNGWDESDLEGFKTPLDAEFDVNNDGFLATPSGGLYLESLPFAVMQGAKSLSPSPYKIYNRMLNLDRLMLSRANEFFELYLGHEDAHDDVACFGAQISFNKISSLIRGRKQSVILELISYA